MEKENNLTIITRAAQKKNTIKNYHYCFNNKEKNKEFERGIKQAKEIKIYDITYNKKQKKGEQSFVKDHINKTGKNPLLAYKTISFIDLTGLYINANKGVITTCLGTKYIKQKTKNLNPSTEMCLISILCKKINPHIKIKGILINCL